MRFSQAAAPLLTLALAGCVSGNQIRASADVIKQDIERAKESGAMRCAPRELALAEANMNFALADLAQGASFTAREEIKEAEVSVKRALSLSKDCGKKQILVREKDPDPVVKPPPMVVKIEETDQDRDGLLDRDDKCPEQAEDKDAFQDEDGCPDPDNDGDDVLDTNDKCPLVRGPLSNQGCPEGPVKDTDGDGVPDNADKCPDQAEDKDSFRDEDGCPDPDNDEDGLVDGKDKCPNEAGPIETIGCPLRDTDGDGLTDNIDKCPDKKGAPENSGCPDLDRDGDGIPDRLDKCPDQMGGVDRQGCPLLDRDGDGANDDLDRCPDQAEDKDGFEDQDGCPDLDNDADKTPDRMDKCPDQAGPVENFGCPDVDKDGDGVADRLDKCPDEPEDKDGFEDKDGCPDLDNDQDGIPDAQDKCATKAGPAENEGCPDLDKDGDGVPDRLDKCPEEFGVKDEQGCQKKYKLVVVKKDRIEIKQQIKFKTGSAKIIGTDSFAIIAEVASAMRDNPQIKKIRVEGHTDSVGNDAANLKLSQERAGSVMAAMIKEGVDPARMEAVGYGETKPIASNSTKNGRAENRRTEFNIVEQ
jgi:outer membrane protein OmpA-like peptidoglycan-associated protein